MDFNVICRICLCDGDMSPLDTEVNGQSYIDKILQCTNIQLKTHTNFPEQICSKCVVDLETAYLFRLNCESSDAILIGFFESQTKQAQQLKQETDDDVESEDDIPDPNDDKSSEQGVNSEIEFLDNLTSDIVNEEYLNDHELTHYTETATDHIELISELPMDESEESQPMPNDVIVITNLPLVKTEAQATPRPKATKQQNSKAFSHADADQHVCELCGNCYKQKYSLDVHMRRHQNIKPFKCEQCDLSFVIPFELKRHQRTHTGDKPYACQHCGRKFSDFGSRVKHERTHTGERPYRCSQCSKSFAYSHVLNSHLLVHTGEKNHVCTICDKRFAKAHHLKSHRNVHLKEQGVELTQSMSTANFFVIEDHREEEEEGVQATDGHPTAEYMEIFENTSTSHQFLLTDSQKSFVLEQKFFPKP